MSSTVRSWADSIPAREKQTDNRPRGGPGSREPGKVSNPKLKRQERHPIWDPDKQGVLRGEQHYTYDINFYGPSSMTGSLYLAAASMIYSGLVDEGPKVEVTLSVLHRRLSLDSFDLPASYGFTSLSGAALNDTPLQVGLEPEGDRLVFHFSPTLEMKEGDRLTLASRRSSS